MKLLIEQTFQWIDGHIFSLNIDRTAISIHIGQYSIDLYFNDVDFYNYAEWVYDDFDILFPSIFYYQWEQSVTSKGNQGDGDDE